MEHSFNRVLATWPALLVLHFLFATVASLLFGFLPEGLVGALYYNTGVEPYSPVITLIAFLLGYFLSFRVLGLRAAEWTWVIGVLWFLVGVHDLTSHWDASWSPEKTRSGYVLASLFGPTLKCRASECLYEVVFTTPFAASITYSVGAYLRRRLHRIEAVNAD